jgi:hypothetical protein
MVRQGAVQCTTCHISPTGGGILNDTGRKSSKEILSQNTGDERFLNGTATPPEWLRLGGDLRFFQFFKDNQTETVADFSTQQMDLEVAATNGDRFSVVGTIGHSTPPKDATSMSQSVISRRHWLQALVGPKSNPDQLTARMGRFFPAYGINIPEHAIVTRSRLGFDAEQESYNLELALRDEDWEAFGTLILGRPDNLKLHREQGYSLQISRVIENTYRLGINGYTGILPGSRADTRRNLMGVFAHLGFTPSVYSLIEIDTIDSGQSSRSFLNYAKLGWEWKQGLHFFTNQERARLFESYGIGIQYFPWPHWDLTGTFRLERDRRTSPSSTDFDRVTWIALHYYL